MLLCGIIDNFASGKEHHFPRRKEMNKQEIIAHYSQQVAQLTAEIKLLRSKNRMFILAELLSFGLAIAAVAAFTATDWGRGLLLLAVAFVAIYVIIRRIDDRNSCAIERKECLLSVYKKEISYHEGHYNVFADGAEYADASHPFTFDMDVFGADSLFNRINRTITTGGADWLSAELSQTDCRTTSVIREHRDAIKELADAADLRAEFMSYGQRERIDTQKILESLQRMRAMQIPKFAASRAALVLAVVALVAFYAVVVGALLGKVSANAALLWAFVQFFLVFGLCSAPLRTISNIVNKMHKQLKSYVQLITIVSTSDLKATENAGIRAALQADGADSLASFRQLNSILDSLDRRGNVLGMFFTDTLFLSDLFLIRRFLRWQSKYMSHIDEWISAVSHFDSLVSMATFRYNEPSGRDAEFTESKDIEYHIKGMRHPFLGEKAVANDFDIADSNYYIITGANMAGKSTFLRSLGINYILASCGMPVFAEAMRVSVFSLFSSMRTTDELTRGISYFNAELIRLRQLIDYCKGRSRTLIILDEILKGTNSLDKLNGSRLFLQHISAMPVTGVIATHDLELSRLAEEQPRFHNYCFEIQLAERITYTYKITPGVAKNQNATYLLKRIIES